jgi:hypothetical protein
MNPRIFPVSVASVCVVRCDPATLVRPNARQSRDGHRGNHPGERAVPNARIFVVEISSCCQLGELDRLLANVYEAKRIDFDGHLF